MQEKLEALAGPSAVAVGLETNRCSVDSGDSRKGYEYTFLMGKLR